MHPIWNQFRANDTICPKFFFATFASLAALLFNDTSANHFT